MKHSLFAAALAGMLVFVPSVAQADDAAEPRIEEAAPATTTPTTTGTADRPQSEAQKSDANSEAFRIGAVGGVGFPRPLAIEGMVKLGGVVALGIEYSVFPKSSFSGVATSSWALAGDARLFPFKGAFFIGLRAGHQRIDASTTVTVGSFGSFNESATADTWFLNPRLGFLWTWNSGFTVGVDAGVQIPISPSLSTTLPDGTSSQVTGTVASIANTFGNGVTPTVDLLRIGFLF